MLPIRRLLSASLLLGLSLPVLAQQAQALKWINMRAGPARDYPLVAQFPPDSLMSVQGCTSGYGWCDTIGPTGARGWVYAGNLAYLDQGNQYPLLGYGNNFGIPVIGFALGAYWGSYYQGQPWFGRRQEWRGRDLDRGGRPSGGRPMPDRAMPDRAMPNRASAPPPDQRGGGGPAPGMTRPRGAQGAAQLPSGAGRANAGAPNHPAPGGPRFSGGAIGGTTPSAGVGQAGGGFGGAHLGGGGAPPGGGGGGLPAGGGGGHPGGGGAPPGGGGGGHPGGGPPGGGGHPGGGGGGGGRPGGGGGRESGGNR